MTVPKPLDLKLYNYVKKLADKKFQSKTGIYKSSWIVREYKKRGGKYSTNKRSRKLIGLRRWYKEKWVDLNRPIKSNNKIIGYEECGRKSIEMKKKNKSTYPLCRPSIRITEDTPRTYKEISEKSIKKAKIEKKKVKGSKNIQFGSGKLDKDEDTITTKVMKATKTTEDTQNTKKYNKITSEVQTDNNDEDNSNGYTLLLLATLFVSLFNSF